MLEHRSVVQQQNRLTQYAINHNESLVFPAYGLVNVSLEKCSYSFHFENSRC